MATPPTLTLGCDSACIAVQSKTVTLLSPNTTYALSDEPVDLRNASQLLRLCAPIMLTATFIGSVFREFVFSPDKLVVRLQLRVTSLETGVSVITDADTAPLVTSGIGVNDLLSVAGTWTLPAGRYRVSVQADAIAESAAAQIRGQLIVTCSLR